MFINVGEELQKARENGYAIGAFNTSNLEVTKAICAAAKERNASVIIQTSPKSIKYAGLKQLFDIVKNEIEETGISAAIHLDHATDFELIREAIEVGYRSIMFDGSKLAFEENISETKKIVDYAHSKNVSVEGEIGIIPSGSQDEARPAVSDPEEVKRFVDITGVDSVAISIGNQHGAPEGEKIDLELLKKIAELVKIPLVLHGSSGLSDEDIKQAINTGVAKINIDTLIRRAFMEGLQSEVSTNDFRELLRDTMERVTDVVAQKIDQLKA